MKNRVIWLTAAILIGFIGFSPGYAAPGDNILTNGGFEGGNNAGWAGYGDHTQTVVTELVDAAVSDAPIEGDYCLHVVVPTTPANFWETGIQTWQGQTFEEGKHYTLSVFMKSKSGAMQINVKPELGADPWTAYGEQMVTITEEWVEYSVTTPVLLRIRAPLVSPGI